MSDVKFSQYETATLPAWRSKRLGFESGTKLIKYDWSDGTESQILSLNPSGVLVNTVTFARVADIGNGATISLGSSAVTLSAGDLYLSDTTKKIQIGGEADGSFKVTLNTPNHAALLQINNGGSWITCLTVSVA